MSSDLSFTHLVLNASPVVQLVMLLLVFASMISWTMIFDRIFSLKKAKRNADQFERRFWSGGDVRELYRSVDRE